LYLGEASRGCRGLLWADAVEKVAVACADISGSPCDVAEVPILLQKSPIMTLVLLEPPHHRSPPQRIV
jgi:hypothetical protein